MFELTSTQLDIYLEGKALGGAVNNIGGYQRLSCEIDVSRFRAARRLLMERNDAYRLRFVESSGACRAVLTDLPPPEMTLLDLREREKPAEEALRWIQQQFELPFAKLDVQVFQDALLRIRDGEYWYFAKAHHLIMDGRGFTLQMQRLLATYEQLRDGAVDSAPPEPSFSDYMRGQRDYPASAQYAASRDYWLTQYATAPPTLFAPTTPGGAVASGRTSTAMSRGDFDALLGMCEATGSNVVTLFHAVLYLYFSRAYGCADLVIGAPVHNRRSANEKRIIGAFVNVVPHRLRAAADLGFRELLQFVAQQHRKDQRHSRYPFGDLFRNVRDRVGTAGSIYQLAFNYQKLDFQLVVDGVEVETHYLSHNRERTPLTLVVCDYGPNQDVTLHLDYACAFFNHAEATAILARLTNLLDQVRVDSSRAVSDYALLTDHEAQLQAGPWRGTVEPIDEHILLHEMFEAQAASTPDAIAVVTGSESLTYRELDARANRVARRLAEAGVKPGAMVAICHARSADLVGGLLGILKAGAAFVAVDTAYPPARVSYILEDSKVQFVLADRTGIEVIEEAGMQAVVIETSSAAGAADGEGSQAPAVAVAAVTDLAYVIYTSGSTGQPKGVMIEHRSAAALVQWALGQYTRDDLAAVLASTSICFDLSIFEIFVPLAAGGRIVLVENALALRDGTPDAVTLINTVPSAIAALLDVGAIPSSVRCINLAGELLRQELVDALYAVPGVRVYDLYGPSEDTTYSTVSLRTPQGRQTIGRPLPNTQAYVLDPNGQPLPPGMVGELHLGGVGLARGYLHRPELTAEKFIECTYAQSRVYRTGDLVRFTADGELQYIGRKDHQVKIRGFRIELGEIEACLRQHAGVRDCVVTAHRDVNGAGPATLVAYIVPTAPGFQDAGEVHLLEAIFRHVADMLPHYMMPAGAVFLPELPLTPNGKVDRAALPSPQARDARIAAPVPPRSPLEARLAERWEALLGGQRIGVHDNFFARGGDSLLLMRLAAFIEADHAVRVDVAWLFDAPTIEKQAQLIEQQQRIQALVIAVSDTRDLSDANSIVL